MKNKTTTIVDLVDSLRSGLWVSGHYSVCESYAAAASSVLRFSGNPSLTVRELFTKDFLYRYQMHLMFQNLKRNTISFYMSILRMLYREAVRLRKVRYEEGLFSDVFTDSEPTEKRAVNPGIIGILATADLSDFPRLERCRHYFVLSFLLQGMPFIDLAHLRKSDIREDEVVYRRHKTGAVITVPLQDGARFILSKYAGEVSDSPYALPILDPQADNPRCCYKSALRKQNRRLEALANHLGIEEHLTTYVARHSWATIAHHHDVAIGVVSQAMGHQSEEVTRAYLKSFGHEHLQAAGRVVLDAVLKPVLKHKLCSIHRLRELGLLSENAKGKEKSTLCGDGGGFVNASELLVYKEIEGVRIKKKKCPSTWD